MTAALDRESWSVTDSADLYEVARWGNGYFSIADDGNLLVHPDKSPERHIDLKKLIDRLEVRGIRLPVLLRFGEILQHRLQEINKAFSSSMKESLSLIHI